MCKYNINDDRLFTIYNIYKLLVFNSIAQMIRDIGKMGNKLYHFHEAPVVLNFSEAFFSLRAFM